MLGIHGKGNQQRRKEDNLKEERTPEFHFQSPPACRNNKEDAEQEVIETHGGNAA
jgi:hypothetical protein